MTIRHVYDETRDEWFCAYVCDSSKCGRHARVEDVDKGEIKGWLTRVEVSEPSGAIKKVDFCPLHRGVYLKRQQAS
ncbi:MAG: hypothetical protein M1343_09155 [Chloroflexi bacterium]|nr:hypothetical protein [Chloroflexota bacterium]MDA8187888.1 hypothetical protein [Dehalococcoidales bacterium]